MPSFQVFCGTKTAKAIADSSKAYGLLAIRFACLINISARQDFYEFVPTYIAYLSQ
jgi:hypothetical protein